jgi:hypothetical protein
MRLLELFSGTGSVGDVFTRRGWEVISLDRDMPADHRVDILAWDCPYQPHHFDFIWASPPCTEYSIAKTVGERRLEEADAVTRRTIELIRYLDPPLWVIENPQSGLLKSREFMAEIPFHDVDYCRYGMPYRKRTRLWGELGDWTPRPLCRWDCPASVDGKHSRTAQQRSRDGTRHKQRDLYKVPAELVAEVARLA